jgi:hypothetical protein
MEFLESFTMAKLIIFLYTHAVTGSVPLTHVDVSWPANQRTPPLPSGPEVTFRDVTYLRT